MVIEALQLLQTQIRFQEYYGKPEDNGILIEMALGLNADPLPIAIRKEMFSNINLLRKDHSGLSEGRIDLNEKSILKYFKTTDEFMASLSKVMLVDEIKENPGFHSWIHDLSKSADPEFKKKTMGSYKSLWEQISDIEKKVEEKRRPKS